MVRAVSSVDDKLAWWSILQLVSAIERLPSASSSDNSPQTLTEEANRGHLRDLSEDIEEAVSSISNPRPEEEDSAPATVESRALTLPRGSLLLALISLLPSVNLALFPSLLDEISRLVDLESPSTDGRKALGQWTFEVLGSGMDVVKREEGVRWWMNNGQALLNGSRRKPCAEQKVEVEEIEGTT